MKTLAKILIWGLAWGTIALVACSKQQSYEEIVAFESNKSIRNDSLIFDVSFKMNYEQFYYYCWDMNGKGMFFPNQAGTKVQALLNEGFHSPVIISFFPKIEQEPDLPITRLLCSIEYKQFSYYDTSLSVEHLVKETMEYLEKGHGGRKFITLPQEPGIIKNHFVKIDANRQITIKPSANGEKIDVVFTDLSAYQSQG